MINKHKPRYIGDGVYADFDGYHIILTTSDGVETTNTIALEPAVLGALKDYVEYLKNVYERKSDHE